MSQQRFSIFREPHYLSCMSVCRVAMRSVMPGIISAVPRHAWCHPAHFLRIDLGLMTAPLSPQTTAAPRAPGSWWLLLSPANTSLSSEIVTTQPSRPAPRSQEGHFTKQITTFISFMVTSITISSVSTKTMQSYFGLFRPFIIDS